MDDPVDEGRGLLRIPIQPPAEVFLDGPPDAGTRRGVTQHAARGALELGMVEPHRHDRRQTLADTIGVEAGGGRRQQLPLPARTSLTARLATSKTI